MRVAFRQHQCIICTLNGVLKDSFGSNLYSIAMKEITSKSPIYLLSKATYSQSLLWHHRLSHLNLNTINELSKKNLVIVLPSIKLKKCHLCSACELGKIKRMSLKSKPELSSVALLRLLHIDLCGPMRVQSINGMKYILVIVDDYSRYI